MILTQAVVSVPCELNKIPVNFAVCRTLTGHNVRSLRLLSPSIHQLPGEGVRRNSFRKLPSISLLKPALLLLWQLAYSSTEMPVFRKVFLKQSVCFEFYKKVIVGSSFSLLLTVESAKCPEEGKKGFVALPDITSLEHLVLIQTFSFSINIVAARKSKIDAKSALHL